MRPIALWPLATTVLILAGRPALAVEEAQPEQSVPANAPSIVAEEDIDTANEIVVVATRLRGEVDAPQPPIATFEPEDIEAYGVSSIAELVEAVAPQTGSGRGRGDGRPVFLLNGQRISSFREMRNIPPEAIRRMEVLPEEVALRYGYPANQRVLNFILRENFTQRSIRAEYSTPTRGGFDDKELDASLLQINGNNRLNLSFEADDTSLLTERERGVIQQPGTLPTVAGDADPAQFRSLVADTRNLSLTGSWSGALGEAPNAGSVSANASISRSDSRSLSGLNSLLLTAPGGLSVLRTLPDPLARSSRTVSVEGGAALNKPLAAWQLSVTGDGSLNKTETLIDRRADTRALRDAAIAGTLNIGGALPAVALAGTDRARTRSVSFSSLATLSGEPFSLPAGGASLTAKAGYAHTGIRSRDTRGAAGLTSLKRDDLNAGVNLGLPIASRRDDVLAAIGDLSLNLSAGVNHLSDFGTLKDWSIGLTWGITDKLGLQASYIVNEAAPSLSELGNPVVQTFNVPVFDFSRGETALVTLIGGGNPALRREKQQDLKLSANWELPFLRNSNFIVEYFRNRSDDVPASFPLLTPAIEAAFPGRATRDGSGRLLSIDRRSVTLDESRSSRIRYGVNLSGNLGKAPPQRGGGRRGEGMGRGGGDRGPGMGGPGMGRRGGGRGPGGPGGGGFGRGGPDGGGPRMGGPGMGGRGMGGRGGGNGQGRWNVSVFHTYRFSERVLVAPGGPELDLLDGDALTGGGVSRHSLQFEGGAFYRGFGLRFNGTWTAPTRVNGTGLPGSTDLRFGSKFDVDLRAFLNFDQEKNIVEKVPFLKGSRLSIEIENVFDSRQQITDQTGAVPLSYQRDLVDPRGRTIGLSFRKVF